MIELERQLEKLQDEYMRKADALIADARAKYVIPFCDKHGFEFSAGMGSWSFTPIKRGVDTFNDSIGGWNGDRLPKRLLAVLQTNYGMGRNNCGSMMLDYRPQIVSQSDKNVRPM